MTADGVLELVIQLSLPSRRRAAAAALARALGVEEILLLVLDPAPGVLLPAPGCPQTLRGGPSWRAFLERCAAPGCHRGRVELPLGSTRAAHALVGDGAALVLLGGSPEAAGLATIERLLPMLAACLAAEQQALIARAEATEANESAARATALAQALETSRAHAARLNAELREEHRRKDDFLAMLAHELRNPLAPLLTVTELLRSPRGGAELRERHLEVMERQIGLLSRLVDDLLDVSRVSRGRIELQREPLELGELLSHAIETARPLLESSGHRFELLPADEPLPVLGDRVRLAQVFANLLSNAAKYTPAGGRVVIAVEKLRQHAVVRIHDNGVGISPDMLARVFDLFVQAPTALDRAQGGLGIGLTLARSLIELHGGELTAESPGLGQGSTFTVRLPLSSVEPVPASQAPPVGAECRPSPIEVLVVDDNRDAADSLAAMLELLGHRPRVSYDGLDALRQAAEQRPELVVLDIGLPHLDGYEVARRLRRSLPQRTFLVALTGYGAPEDRRRSREAGFDEHMVKPLDPHHLRALLARVIATHRPAIS